MLAFPIHHIGLAVHNLDQAIEHHSKCFGLTLSSREVLPTFQVEIAFLETGNTRIELLTPTEPDSGVAKFLEKRGEGLHHLCYQVNDIDQEYGRLVSLGYTPIDPAPRAGAHNTMVAFFHPAEMNGVLTELCQHKQG